MLPDWGSHFYQGIAKGNGVAVGDTAVPLIARANALLDNRLRFFDVELTDAPARITWNYEYSVRRHTPVSAAAGIDYRSFTVTGDAKVVWEPNRHQHLVVLAQAFRTTGERRYAEKVIEQIDTWIEQCPYKRGMNWRSPLELAIRLINWVWALDLIAPSGVVTDDFRQRSLPVVFRHLWEITRHYSRFSSANNHLIGEAAGVFIGSTFFSTFRKSRQWKDQAREILSDEIEHQTLGDGGNCELSPSYHLFVLEFFLLAGIVGRRSGQDFEKSYWDRLESMFGFTAALLEGGDSCPAFGDSDDGYVLDLETSSDRSRSLLGVGAELFGRRDFKALAGGCSERTHWLLGDSTCDPCDRDGDCGTGEPLRSRSLPESGYYLLQHGRRDEEQDDRISVVFDCGALGYGSIAAHGHADALSFTLRALGVDVLVDPGTYDYFTYSDWRNYFRSTRAHNTVVVDGVDQSEMTGLFLWGRRAVARRLDWQPTSTGGLVCGSHDGYTRLTDPVAHRRTVTLDGNSRIVTVQDELEGRSTHSAELYFHFSERCLVADKGNNQFRIDFGPGRLELNLEGQLKTRLRSGCLDPIAGWVSRGYHRKTPTPTVIATCSWSGRLALRTQLVVTDTGEKLSRS